MILIYFTTRDRTGRPDCTVRMHVRKLQYVTYVGQVTFTTLRTLRTVNLVGLYNNDDDQIIISLWAKSRNGVESAIKISFKAEMDFADFLESIAEKRAKFQRVGAILAIHSKNNNDEDCVMRPGEKVPEPIQGQVGSSDDNPYFFSVEQAQAGNLD